MKASSIYNSYFLTSPSDSLLQLLWPKKIIAIWTMMNIMLASNNCNMNITVRMVTAITSANLRSISPQVPYPFSCFNNPYHDASQINPEDDIRMQLMASNGIGVDKATADILSKENYKIPYSTHKLCHNWTTGRVFLDESLIAEEASHWVLHIDKLESTWPDWQSLLPISWFLPICSETRWRRLGSPLPREQEIWDPAKLLHSKQMSLKKETKKMKNQRIKRITKRNTKEMAIPKILLTLVPWWWTQGRWLTGTARRTITQFLQSKWIARHPLSRQKGQARATNGTAKGTVSRIALETLHISHSMMRLKKNYVDWVKDPKKKFLEKP